VLISPDGLIDEGLLRPSDCDEGRSFAKNAVDHDAVIRFKHKLLEKAWTTFSATPRSALRQDYEQFCAEQGHWLDDYALFRALKVAHGGVSYLEWPEESVRREPMALAQARRDLKELIEQVRFAQFLLFRQGARLREYARAKGVHLIGDLPFFVSPDSSDVWANPELFLLDERHRPRFVAGVPPDYFSAEGQLWGNPVYNWLALERTGYRDMVKALHRAGIEVILDVVYNHTAEGGENGPTLCFKGFANDAYYILDRDTARYANYTGTGNTLNANEPFVRRLIRDRLHYWVEVMHVDGFRFDLASILSRDECGRPLENPPILWDIDSDPALADTKLIAEAWDAAGLYQVGSFITPVSERIGWMNFEVRMGLVVIREKERVIVGEHPYLVANLVTDFAVTHDATRGIETLSYTEPQGTRFDIEGGKVLRNSPPVKVSFELQRPSDL
jgi:hypothetical protein